MQYSKQLLDMPKTGTYDQKLRKTMYSRKRAIDNLGIGFNGKGLKNYHDSYSQENRIMEKIARKLLSFTREAVT